MKFFITLSYDGWLHGISSFCVLIYACIFGTFLIYKSKRTDAKLLLYAGLDIILIGLTYLGAFVDFITILLTGKNMDNPNGLRFTLGLMWIPPTVIIAMYLGAELIIPNKKHNILAIYIVLGIIFELFLFLDPEGSYEFVYPKTSGENLIEGGFIFGSPLFILFTLFFLSMVLFMGFGSLYKSFHSIGLLRKKFLFLALGVFFLVWTGFNNNIFPQSIFTASFMIAGNVVGFWVFYLALREESDEPRRVRPNKEVKVKESLFRITSRPSQITEEEVSISKEKKICIVCKGKVSKLLYMCPECNTFYCVKCSNALTNTENVCWVCNAPIDESKPSQPYKNEKEDLKISSEKVSSEKAKKI